MTSIATIADHMREQEATWERQVPPEQWIILRMDGRGFSRLTEAHYHKPFDERFQQAMLAAATHLLTTFDGHYAYVGSDEISLVLPPEWDGYHRRVQKLLSLSAAEASVAFTQASGHAATFDSRLLALTSAEEVLDYLHWRKEDVRRNAVTTCLYWTLRQQGEGARQVTRRILHKNQGEQIQMLAELGIAFGDLDGWQRVGVGLMWQTYYKPGYNPQSGQHILTERRRIVPLGQPGDNASLRTILFYRMARPRGEEVGEERDNDAAICLP